MRHLGALVALDESESFTVAASVLGISQPTLSRTIGQLEDLVGVELVDRTTRYVRLTERGIEFVIEARSIVGQLDRLLERFAEQSGALRLGWAWAGLGTHTHGLIKAWQAGSDVPIEASRPDDLEAALARSSIDIAIVKKAMGEPRLSGETISLPLFRESLIAAVSRSNPLATADHLTLDLIAHSPVALCSVSPTASLRLWDDRPITPAPVLARNTDEWLLDVVLDKAVGVTAAATAFSHPHPEVTYLEIEDSPEVEVSIAWNSRAAHPSCAEFAQFAQRHFDSLTATHR